MDRLVYNKFDLRQMGIIKIAEDKLVKAKEEFSLKGNLYSSAFANEAFMIFSETTEEIIGALLDTYKEVQKETNDEFFIVSKENENKARGGETIKRNT